MKGGRLWPKIDEEESEKLEPYPQFPIEYGEPCLPEPIFKTKWYS